MTKKITNFRETPNPHILNAIRSMSSRDYRERIPESTQANMGEIADTLNKFPSLKNEFIEALMNQIGKVVFTSNTWNNPLAIFKKGMLPHGSTVEEVAMGLVKARVHDFDRDSLEKDVFGRAHIDVQTSFHTINREHKYKVTVDDIALRRALLDENGLGNFVHEIIGALDKSDEYDEFLLMANLLVENDKANGYYKIHTSAVEGGNESTAKELLVKIREMRSRLGFISTKYNASAMPVAVDVDKLVVITTPLVAASLDVDAYAAAFNIERAQVPDRLVVIPEEHWPITGAQAILTDEDFFQVYDTYMENTMLRNPDGLYTNHWQHHHGIISMSRFVPAILFTSEPVTPEENEQITITGMSPVVLLDGRTGETAESAERGYFTQVAVSAVSSVAGVGEGVHLTLSGAESQFTALTETGALIVGVDETATELTIVATSVVDGTKSVTTTVPVSGEIARRYPDPEILPSPEPGE